MNTITTSQPIYKKYKGIGTKPTKELASVHDLNMYSYEINECNIGIELGKPNIGIFYHKFDYITLKEGIFRKHETDSCIQYKKVAGGIR